MECVLQHRTSLRTHRYRIRKRSSWEFGHWGGRCSKYTLGGVAIAGGVVSGICVALQKATMKKVEKHESVKRTAESSLNTVNDLVSRALENGVVSNEDFHHILREMENYRGHKAGIKHRARADLFELTSEREAQIRAEAEEAGLARGKKKHFRTSNIL